MNEMVYTNDYFAAKIMDLRLALRRLDDFQPIKGISEKVKYDPKISGKRTITKQQKVNE